MRAGDLEHVKKYVSGNLYIGGNTLTSLEGCPEKVTGTFDCTNGHLTSFEHFPKYIKYECFIGGNKIKSFKDIDKHIQFIGGDLYATGMNIKSGFSDLFGIDGLLYVWFGITGDNVSINDNNIKQIANKYLSKYLPSRDIINFQDEMIKAGYESYL